MNKLKQIILTSILLFSVTAFAQTFTATFDATTGAIPDGASTATCFELPVTGIGLLNSTNVGLENVLVNITHEWDADLIISLVAPDGTTVLLSSNRGNDANFINTVFTGNVGDPLISASVPPFTGNFAPEESIGAVNNGSSGDGTWKLCILDNAGGFIGNIDSFSLTFSTNIAPPPAYIVNDNPCGAIMLNVDSSCHSQIFSNLNATATPNVPAPGCSSYSGSDVWFSVIVPAGGAVRFEMQEDTMIDGGLAIYSGHCDNLSLIECNDDAGLVSTLMPLITLANQTPGDTLWLRVWEYGNDNNGTFGICAALPPPPPANDEPCNAVTLNVEATCTYQTFTNTNATSSSTAIPLPGCALYTGADVWFNAVVPAGGAVRFDTQADTMYDGGMAVYSGSCDNLSLITCDDNTGTGSMPQITFHGLTPGDTLWVRMWDYGNYANGNFGICASVPPPAPLNDDPCNATTLVVSNTCQYVASTNEDATGSLNVPDPGCAGYSGGDVWFKVVVPDTGATLIFDTQAGVLTDGGMAIYSGTCDNLTLLDCDDDGLGTTQMPQITAANLTPGDTIWVRVWEFSNDNNGSFQICVSTSTTTTTPDCGNNTPAGNTCDIAPQICNFNGYCGNTSAAYTRDTWSALTTAFSSCLGGASIENNSFVAFVASSTTATFNVYVTSSLRGGGIQMFFYSGDCNADVVCHGGFNNLRMRAAPWPVTASNLIPGNTYYLMFDGYGGDVCNYLIAPTSGVDILAISPGAATICKGSNVTLTASGGNPPYTWTGIGGTAPIGLNATQGQTVIASPDSTTSYFVTAIASSTNNNCPITQKVTVKVNPSPVPPIVGQGLEYCQGAIAIPLTATALATYTLNWYTDSLNGTSSPTPITPSTSNSGVTTYYVSQSTPLGCESPRSQIPVAIKTSFGLEVGGPFDLFNGQTIQTNPILTGITVSQLSNILWTPSQGVSSSTIINPSITPVINNGQAIYNLTITDSLGCSATDTLIINVVNKCIFIKNAFSPNGDGINDRWQIYNTRECVTKITVNVFNRNGSKVYQVDDYFNDWDGTYKGKPLPDGTYYAVIDFVLVSGKRVTTKADVTILR